MKQLIGWLTVLLVAAPAARAAHPGQHLDLRISINEKRVRYDIILSTDLSNLIFLNDATDFEPIRAEQRFRFRDPEREVLTRAAFAAFFKDGNPVTIDGVLVKPILKDLSFVPNEVLAGEDDPYSFPPDARIILEYPCKGMPRQVSMVWDLYPVDVSRAAFGLNPTLDVIAQLDVRDTNKLVAFSAEEPEVIWHAAATPVKRRPAPVVAQVQPATLPIPVVSAGLGLLALAGLFALRNLRRAARRLSVAAVLLLMVSAAFARDFAVVQLELPWAQRVQLPDEDQALTLFAALHENVYRAFDYKTESDIYDVLAQSVAGELLEQVYTEIYQSLIMRDQGGAVARVQSVNVLAADVASAGVLPDSKTPAFKVRTRWQVHGAVYHWGHVHARTNEYQATYTVSQRGENWKITAVEDVEQRRLQETEPAASQPAGPIPGREF